VSTRHRLVVFAVASLGIAACGPFRRGAQNGVESSFILFVNQSNDQADVYAIPTSGQQVRLGTVAAGRTERLALPTAAVGGDGMINIVARVFASSRTPRTGRVSLMAGQGLEVTLPPEENMLGVLPAPEP
jgi:hypothetical protein